MFENLKDCYYYLYHYEVAGGLTLKATGLVIGIILVLTHITALIFKQKTQDWLKNLPRNVNFGRFLMTLNALWMFAHFSWMDMRDFYKWRQPMLIAVPLMMFLMCFLVTEFLSVRAIAIFMLLAAELLLTAAFLQPPVSRLLLPILAYLWILVGMTLLVKPYWMRDCLNWLLSRKKLYFIAIFSGIIYGLLMLICSFLYY
jgi:hypothetical protein